MSTTPKAMNDGAAIEAMQQNIAVTKATLKQQEDLLATLTRWFALEDERDQLRTQRTLEAWQRCVEVEDEIKSITAGDFGATAMANIKKWHLMKLMAGVSVDFVVNDDETTFIRGSMKKETAPPKPTDAAVSSSDPTEK